MTTTSVPSTPQADTIDCTTAVRRLWDYLDGRLDTIAREEVEAHLTTCEKCPPHFAFAERIKESLRGNTAPAMSNEDEVRLRERVRGALARMTMGDDEAGRNSLSLRD